MGNRLDLDSVQVLVEMLAMKLDTRLVAQLDCLMASRSVKYSGNWLE
jgi:hypothetical protein